MTSIENEIENQINVWMKRIGVLRHELDTHPFIYSLGFRFKPESNFHYRKLRENEINELMRKISVEEERNLRILRTKQVSTLEKSGVNTSKLNFNVKPNQSTIDMLNIAADLAVSALDIVVNGDKSHNYSNNQSNLVDNVSVQQFDPLPQYDEIPQYDQFPQTKYIPEQTYDLKPDLKPYSKPEYIFPTMDKKYNCRRCNKEFDSFNETINHQNTVCKNPKENIKKYNCRRCNKEFDSFNETINHQNTVCKNNSKIQNKEEKEHIKNNGSINNPSTDQNPKIYIKEKIPPTVRNSVWNRHIGAEKKIGKCVCCNTEQISFANFQCGHVQSEKEGGKVCLQNLRPVCAQCNSSMGTQNMEDFMKQYGYKKYANWYYKEEEEL
ncbi:MAG: HNH endonuclease [Terrestrivirus sp.]|uniref:HNH endonuclease n=1 Tax=Terrestrivirus sp. TaxID=2487775 RepID=A0A3G4ZMP2_9VIRU|nr:MAG: HNH endonuclease [Terrestrivirus sp.]